MITKFDTIKKIAEESDKYLSEYDNGGNHMTTPRPIRPHKCGRTARAPEARIRPQTLERIHEAMREQGKTFADLIEDQYTTGEVTMLDFEKIAKKVRKDGEKCIADDVKRLYDSLDAANKKAVTEKWLFDSLRNTQPPIKD